jgi:hypothetical protein
MVPNNTKAKTRDKFPIDPTRNEYEVIWSLISIKSKLIIFSDRLKIEKIKIGGKIFSTTQEEKCFPQLRNGISFKNRGNLMESQLQEESNHDHNGPGAKSS